MTLPDLANLPLPTLATLAGLTVQGHRSTLAELRAAAYAVPGCHPDAHVRQLDGLTKGDHRPAVYWEAQALDWDHAARDPMLSDATATRWRGYAEALWAWWEVVVRHEEACTERRALRGTEAPEHLPVTSWAWCPNPPRKRAPKAEAVVDIESRYIIPPSERP